MRRSPYIALIILISANVVFGQSNTFDQYYTAKLFINPAYSSTGFSPEIGINYGQSFESKELVQLRTQASIMMPLRSKNFDSPVIGGIGISAGYAQRGYEGAEKLTSTYLTYSQNVLLRKDEPEILSIGLQAGIEFTRIDYTGLLWGHYYSPYLDGDSPDSYPVSEFNDSGSSFILNSGLLYLFNRERNFKEHKWSLVAGISGWGLNRPNISLSKENEYIPPILMRYHGHAEYFTGTVYLKPSFLVLHYAEGIQVNTGLYMGLPVKLGTAGFGSKGLELLTAVWYRAGDSFTFILGFDDDRYGARMSYNLNQNIFYPGEVAGTVPPSIEISAQYRYLKW